MELRDDAELAEAELAEAVWDEEEFDPSKGYETDVPELEYVPPEFIPYDKDIRRIIRGFERINLIDEIKI